MSDIQLIDSHCHLIFENFEKDLEEVVQRLRSKGVKKLVHACCELKEIPKLKKISHRFNEIYYKGPGNLFFPPFLWRYYLSS